MQGQQWSTKGANEHDVRTALVRRASLGGLGDLAFSERIVSNPYTIHKLTK